MTESPTKKINITVKTASGSKYEIQVETTITIGELKKLLEEKSQVAAEQQRLIYSGKVLRDELTLADYCNNSISIYSLFFVVSPFSLNFGFFCFPSFTPPPPPLTRLFSLKSQFLFFRLFFDVFYHK
jgi:hypothetical protein